MARSPKKKARLDDVDEQPINGFVSTSPKQWTYNSREDGSLVPYSDSDDEMVEVRLEQNYEGHPNDYHDDHDEENAQTGLLFWQMEQRRNAANNYDVHVEARSFRGGALHTFTAYWPDAAGEGPNNDAIHSMVRALQARLRTFLPYPSSMARAWRASLILTVVVETQRGVEEWDPFTLSSRDDCALNAGCENARAPFPNNIVRYNTDARPFMEGVEAALFERVVDSSNLDYIARTSQWHLIRIVEMSVQLSRYAPQRGAGYISFPGTNVLPKLAGVRNPKNIDDFCCLWALSLGLYPTHVNKQGKQIKTKGVKLASITLKYVPNAPKRALAPHKMHLYKIGNPPRALPPGMSPQNVPRGPNNQPWVLPKGMRFPMDAESPYARRIWQEFEDLNPSVAVYIWGCSNTPKSVDFLYVSKYDRGVSTEGGRRRIVLLLYREGEHSHYGVITNPVSLMRAQWSKSHSDEAGKRVNAKRRLQATYEAFSVGRDPADAARLWEGMTSETKAMYALPVVEADEVESDGKMCYVCGQCFKNDGRLHAHFQDGYCKMYAPAVCSLPPPEGAFFKASHKNAKCTRPLPIAMFADFETSQKENTCKQSDLKPRNAHNLTGASWVIEVLHDELRSSMETHAPDLLASEGHHFYSPASSPSQMFEEMIRAMLLAALRQRKYVRETNVPMRNLTEAEKLATKGAERCSICLDKFVEIIPPWAGDERFHFQDGEHPLNGITFRDIAMDTSRWAPKYTFPPNEKLKAKLQERIDAYSSCVRLLKQGHLKGEQIQTWIDYMKDKIATLEKQLSREVGLRWWLLHHQPQRNVSKYIRGFMCGEYCTLLECARQVEEAGHELVAFAQRYKNCSSAPALASIKLPPLGLNDVTLVRKDEQYNLVAGAAIDFVTGMDRSNTASKSLRSDAYALRDLYIKLRQNLKDRGGSARHCDHCHLTGEPIFGPDGHCLAHQECNEQANYKHLSLSVFFHNFSGFDGSFFTQYRHVLERVYQEVLQLDNWLESPWFSTVTNLHLDKDWPSGDSREKEETLLVEMAGIIRNQGGHKQAGTLEKEASRVAKTMTLGEAAEKESERLRKAPIYKNIIAANSERIRSISIFGGLVTLGDSAEHLSEPLAKLAKDVDVEKDAPKLLEQMMAEFGLSREQALSATKGKGTLNYEAITSSTYLDTTIETPQKHTFDSKLTNSACMEAEYREVHRINQMLPKNSMRGNAVRAQARRVVRSVIVIQRWWRSHKLSSEMVCGSEIEPIKAKCPVETKRSHALLNAAITLRGKHITSVNVWRLYHDLYLMKDTTLLGAVMKKYYLKCREMYKINPFVVMGTPGLTELHAKRQVNQNGTEVSLLNSVDHYIDMFNRLEISATGGQSGAMDKRHVTLNHPDFGAVTLHSETIDLPRDVAGLSSKDNVRMRLGINDTTSMKTNAHEAQELLQIFEQEHGIEPGTSSLRKVCEASGEVLLIPKFDVLCDDKSSVGPAQKTGEVTTDQFLVGAKEICPLDWLEIEIPKPIVDPLKTSEWLQSPIKPIFQGPHEKVLVESDAAKFTRDMGVQIPPGATHIMFAPSNSMQICAGRITPSVRALLGHSMLPNFVANRRLWMPSKQQESMYHRQWQTKKSMSENEATFLAQGNKELAKVLIGCSFDAHSFWNPSQANSQYFEADENGQYSGALSRMLPIGDYKVNEWAADPNPNVEQQRIAQFQEDLIKKRTYERALFRISELYVSITLQKKHKPAGWEERVKKLESLVRQVGRSEDAQVFIKAQDALVGAEGDYACDPSPENKARLEQAKHYVWFFNPTTGIQVECDLLPPDANTVEGKEKIQFHRDYPPVFEKTTVAAGELSEYTRRQYEKMNQKYDDQVEKLVLHFKPIRRCMRWVNLLGLQLQQGWRLTNVRNYFSCKMEAWLQPIIKQHIDTRRACQAIGDMVGVRLAKLMCNALYGRLQMKVRRFTESKLVALEGTEASTREQIKAASDPRHVGWKDLNDDLAIFWKRKKAFKLDQPVFVASQCLDYAKESMFEFNMRFKLAVAAAGGEARGIRTDTDCVGYYCTSNDPSFSVYNVLAQMQEDEPIFDCEGLPEDDPMHDKTYMKTLNRFGDECGGGRVLQINVIKSKCYSYLKLCLGVKKAGKGTPKDTVKKCQTHWEYTACILGASLDAQRQFKDYTKFCKHNQQIYTMRLNRVTLSNVYTTRKCLDSVNMLPFGYDESWLPDAPQGPEVVTSFLSWASPEQVPAARKRRCSPEPEFLHAAKRLCVNSD